MRQLLLFISLLYFSPLFGVFGQTSGTAATQKRIIYFTDKNNSPFSLQHPLEFLSPKAIERRKRQHIPLIKRDLPVNPAYVAALKVQGISVWYTSRWFNAAIVQCTQEQWDALKQLPFVRSSLTLNRVAEPVGEVVEVLKHSEVLSMSALEADFSEEEDYGPAYHQANMLGALQLHKDGYRGEGMTIAVLDAGFPGVQNIAAFSHLFSQGRIKGTFDFVLKQQHVYGANSHGTAVLSTMAAYYPGKLIGTAYKANYLLLRTEDAATEHPIEEINWLLAAEYADSAGADVINTSLGYTTFDAPSRSYTYTDLDGNTTLVAKAADFAAATGMLVVVSAGNEGNSSWKYIGSPADADSVLAVGAVDSLGTKASFSSFGPSADGQIKPDVVALGQKAYVLNAAGNVSKSNGTSFSGPIVAGFAASLWQANPYRTNYEMIQLLRKMGSNAKTPDNLTGYGIPLYSRYLEIIRYLPKNKEVLITNPVLHQPVILSFGNEWLYKPVEVQVIDVTGKVVHRELLNEVSQEQELKLAPHLLRNGLYLCRLRSGDLIATVRFVKI
ncbi:S8 family serine peptidase [Pontibacter sp. MBLB2868]|uniref:S8 family serine peptidase n=1 Tax=Pontibacter sp. MBLB2868 TaxID=3451555 RepID=UPI003F750DEF